MKSNDSHGFNSNDSSRSNKWNKDDNEVCNLSIIYLDSIFSFFLTIFLSFFNCSFFSFHIIIFLFFIFHFLSANNEFFLFMSSFFFIFIYFLTYRINSSIMRVTKQKKVTQEIIRIWIVMIIILIIVMYLEIVQKYRMVADGDLRLIFGRSTYFLFLFFSSSLFCFILMCI